MPDDDGDLRDYREAVKTAQAGEQSRTLKCPVCGDWVRIDDVTVHMARHEQGRPRPQRPDLVRCAHCGDAMTPAEIVRHDCGKPKPAPIPEQRNLDDAPRPSDMTLRDIFAAHALVGMGTWSPNGGSDQRSAVARAKWCYEQADAMLRARGVSSPGSVHVKLDHAVAAVRSAVGPASGGYWSSELSALLAELLRASPERSARGKG